MPKVVKPKDELLSEDPAVEEKAYTCVICPQSCTITVAKGADGQAVRVYGHTCKRGLVYALAESTNPVRTFTAAVCVPGCMEPLSVRSAEPIPKALLDTANEELKAAAAGLAAPIAVGDVVLANVCGTGVALIATKNL